MPRSRKPWRSISAFREQGIGHTVTLWLSIYASPMSMGWSDAFAVADCWREHNGAWMHRKDGRPTELRSEYVTHFAPAGAALDTGPYGEALDWWRG